MLYIIISPMLRFYREFYTNFHKNADKLKSEENDKKKL